MHVYLISVKFDPNFGYGFNFVDPMNLWSGLNPNKIVWACVWVKSFQNQRYPILT